MVGDVLMDVAILIAFRLSVSNENEELRRCQSFKSAFLDLSNHTLGFPIFQYRPSELQTFTGTRRF